MEFGHFSSLQFRVFLKKLFDSHSVRGMKAKESFGAYFVKTCVQHQNYRHIP